MPRSPSPPRRRERYQESNGYSGRRDGDHGRGQRYEDGRPSRNDRETSSRNDFYGYDENERERERARDRERYNSGRRTDSNGDGGYSSRGGPSRRSASPRARSSRHQSERPRSSSRSNSRSPSENKAKPNFKHSGLLAAETNTVKAADGKSTVLKYNEPPEARKPTLGWRLYVFKGSESLETLHIHRQSAYLIGRDRLVADISIDHPSCSKQHAVIQYRRVQEKDEFGGTKSLVKPFIIDLESTNGTQVNDESIPVSRYYELKTGDVIKFGQSVREYVILHDEAT